MTNVAGVGGAGAGAAAKAGVGAGAGSGGGGGGSGGEIDFVLPSAAQRGEHERTLLELTQVPTAAGREDRVVAYVERWLESRPELTIRRDDAANVVVERRAATPAEERPPLFVTAHMDHPAFVVERMETGAASGATLAHLSFRGGVLDPYFNDAGIVLFTEEDRPVRAVVRHTEKPEVDPSYPKGARFVRACVAEIVAEDAAAAGELRGGDVGRWDLPSAAVEADERSGGRVLRTDACDDLAPLSAALATMDLLREREEAGHVRLLLTRAEEIGFVGAIAACKQETMPRGSRAVLLEASRAFADSPVGGGPIVRVGDRQNTFSPQLTAGISMIGEVLRRVQRVRDGGAAEGTATVSEGGIASAAERFSTTTPDEPPAAFKVQRKLMPGGVCESSAYLAYGYESTCLCLPLGNYHNMADLTAVGDEKDEAAIANARVGREFVSLEDFHNLVLLLTAVGLSLGDTDALTDKLDAILAQRDRVLRERTLFD